MASSSKPLSKSSSFNDSNRLTASHLLPYLRQPSDHQTESHLSQGQSCERRRESGTAIGVTAHFYDPPLVEMDGLRINYPCISIDFETIVNSLKTVHEDVHWDDSPEEMASPSVVESEEVREIDIAALRMQLACDLCGDVMQCPCTSLVCLHSYCRGCIEQEIEKQNGEKFCPVEGCQDSCLDECRPTSLRRHPFWKEHPTIVGDGLLAEVIRKLSRGGYEDPDEATFDTWVPTLVQEAEGIEDLGPIRCIRVKQHRQSTEIADQDSVMEIDQTEQKSAYHSLIATEQSNQTKDHEDDADYITVAIFPFEDEGVTEMDDNYFCLPSHMTGRQFRQYLEERFRWSTMMLYCGEICLTATAYEAMTLGDICDMYWSPEVEDVFTLRYRLDHTTETESPL